MPERFTVEILADKTGPQPPPGQAWPVAGVRILGGAPKELLLPTSFVKRHSAASWLTLEDPVRVERPSQPNPLDEDGSAGVAPEHLLADVQPHVFVHLSRIIFHTQDEGDVAYTVTRQPDKYVGDGSDKKVTLARYEAGDTLVDHFYTCVREG